MHARDALGDAKTAARSGDQASDALLHATVARFPSRDGHTLAARSHRRTGDADAERLARERAVEAARDDVERHAALIELSKCHEHRTRDLAAALQAAERALAELDSPETARRVTRLRGKVEKASKRGDVRA